MVQRAGSIRKNVTCHEAVQVYALTVDSSEKFAAEVATPSPSCEMSNKGTARTREVSDAVLMQIGRH